MPTDITRFLPADGGAAMRAACTPTIAAMQGSLILQIAADVRRLQATGRSVVNLTVGDFKPAHFPLAPAFAGAIHAAIDAGETNYPPADGVPELKAAIAALYRDRLGLDYPVDSVCVASGARPPIYATWALFVEPGDRTVSFLPMWNVGYYAQLFQSDHVYVPTQAEHNFFPTVQQAREAMRGARLVCINTPLNPTGTVISEEVMRGIAEALVEENRGRERPCMLLFDQVYWLLRQDGVEHVNPVKLVPECAPYVIQVDAISKWVAATGLRVGWAVLPPYLQNRMKALIGHIGAWAPRAEQLATAAFLSDAAAFDAGLDALRLEVDWRLKGLYEGICAMQAAGLPISAIAPQGAIYLSLHIDLIGKGFETNEGIRKFLLEAAGVAVVPFQAFDLEEESGWFRMSVGAMSRDDVGVALAGIEAALRGR